MKCWPCGYSKASFHMASDGRLKETERRTEAKSNLEPRYRLVTTPAPLELSVEIHVIQERVPAPVLMLGKTRSRTKGRGG